MKRKPSGNQYPGEPCPLAEPAGLIAQLPGLFVERIPQAPRLSRPPRALSPLCLFNLGLVPDVTVLCPGLQLDLRGWAGRPFGSVLAGQVGGDRAGSWAAGSEGVRGVEVLGPPLSGPVRLSGVEGLCDVLPQAPRGWCSCSCSSAWVCGHGRCPVSPWPRPTLPRQALPHTPRALSGSFLGRVGSVGGGLWRQRPYHASWHQGLEPQAQRAQALQSPELRLCGHHHPCVAQGGHSPFDLCLLQDQGSPGAQGAMVSGHWGPSAVGAGVVQTR